MKKLLNKWLLPFTILVFALFDGQVAFGENVEGVVLSSGSHLNYRVIIKEPQGDKSHKLCSGKVSDSLNRYRRMTAKVEYVKKPTCLDPSSFELTKTPTGKDPVIGPLVKDGEMFSVTSKGVKYTIEYTPKMLRKLKDKKVVLDLAKSVSKIGKQKNYYSVMYFAEAP